jgi:hypothetical protein
MSNTFQKLMEPGYIGKLTTRNRIIKTANGTSYIEPADLSANGPWPIMKRWPRAASACLSRSPAVSNIP